MAFIDTDWWKRTNWFKLFLAGCAVAVLIIYLVFGVALKPNLEHIQSSFGVEIATDGATRLYTHNTQGRFGDGEEYSVWQYQDADDLQLNVELQTGPAFRHDVFDRVTTQGAETPDGYYLPRELDQEVSCYYQDDNDNELLVVFAPEVRLGDGKTYQNLLFVAAWYS